VVDDRVLVHPRQFDDGHLEDRIVQGDGIDVRFSGPAIGPWVRRRFDLGIGWKCDAERIGRVGIFLPALGLRHRPRRRILLGAHRAAGLLRPNEARG
jgi:hypothetical protein